jgi:hypothetical protein
MKISLSLHKIYYFRASLRQDLPEKTPTDKSNAIKTVIKKICQTIKERNLYRPIHYHLTKAYSS